MIPIPSAASGVCTSWKRHGQPMWSDFNREICFGHRQAHPEYRGLRLKLTSSFNPDQTNTFITPLMPHNWNFKDVDRTNNIFEWEFNTVETRRKALVFGTITRYLGEFPRAVGHWFDYREFMSDDEAYLTCIHGSMEACNNSNHALIPSLTSLAQLKGFNFSKCLETFNEPQPRLMFTLIQQPPYFHLINRWLPLVIPFNKYLYTVLEKLAPLDIASAEEFKKEINFSTTGKYEAINFSDLSREIPF